MGQTAAPVLMQEVQEAEGTGCHGEWGHAGSHADHEGCVDGRVGNVGHGRHENGHVGYQVKWK